MTFGWGPGPELEARGIFELFPSIHEESVKLRIKRTRGSDTIAEDERAFALGAPQEIVLKEVRLKVTVTEEELKAKK